MNVYHVNWLLDEMKKWEEKNVVSSDVSEKIRNYYKEQEAEEKARLQKAAEITEEKKKSISAKMPVIFSIIAASLIAAGIISLIAFNWNLISREIKTAGAFVMAISPGLAFFFFSRFKKDFSAAGKEFLALLWSGLTGGMLEFIIQIYRIPVSPVTTLLLWLAVTVMIFLAAETAGSFYLSVSLLIATVITANWMPEITSAVFYPVMAVLIFASGKNKIRIYVLTGTFFLLLGFVLEKCLPGLWIPSYVCALSILLFAGEKKKDKYFLLGAAAGFAVMLTLMCVSWFWEDIGWNNFRIDERHNQYFAVLDYITGGALFLTFAGLIVHDAVTLKKIRLVHAVGIAPVASIVFYILCSLYPELSKFSATFIYLLLAGIIISGALNFKKDYFYLLFFYLSVLGVVCVKEYCVPHLISAGFAFFAIASYRKNKFPSLEKFLTPALALLSAIIWILFSANLHSETQAKEAMISSGIIFTVNILIAVLFFFLDLKINSGKIKTENIPFLIFNFAILLLVFFKERTGDFQTEIFLAVLLVLSVFSFILWRKTGRHSLLLLTGIFFCQTISSIAVNLKNEFIVIDFAVCFISNYGILLSRGKEKKSPLINISLTVFMLISLLPFSFLVHDFFMTGHKNYEEFFYAEVILAYISIAFIVFISMVYPLLLLRKEKLLPQAGINLAALQSLLLFVLEPVLNNAADGIVSVTNTILYFAVIFIFVLQEIISAFKSMSVKKMNVFAVFFFIVLLREFFLQPVSLIARGIVFIISGIVVMILNMIFTKKLREKETSKNEN